MKHYQTIKLVLFITEVIHTWSQTHEFNTFWKKFNLGSFSNNSSHSIKPSSHSLISLSLINNTTGLIENQHFSAYSDPPSRFLHTGLIQTSSENYSLSMLLTNETTTEVAKETTTGKSDEDTSKAIKMTNQKSDLRTDCGYTYPWCEQIFIFNIVFMEARLYLHLSI